MKKLLIVGDSFAAIWPDAVDGWVNLLARRYDVTNLAQAGCSEYKIMKQIQSVDLKRFDLAIVSHTSPSRIHTPHHPLHTTGFHKDCDLLANDIIDRYNWFNPSLKSAQGWFKYHYDDQYQIDIYKLLRRQISDMLTHTLSISVTHTNISKQHVIESCNIDFSELWEKQRGSINHYTTAGNQIVFDTIMEQYFA